MALTIDGTTVKLDGCRKVLARMLVECCQCGMKEAITCAKNFDATESLPFAEFTCNGYQCRIQW